MNAATERERELSRIVGALHFIYSLAIDYEREHGSPAQADERKRFQIFGPKIPLSGD